MNRGIIRIGGWLQLAVGIATFWTHAALANTEPQLSGSYQVMRRSESSGQTHLKLRVHLVNHGTRDLHIQRLTLWDFGHPAKGAAQACSVVVPSAGSAETTQDFTIPRAEYEHWKRGTRPRVVLELATESGRPGTVVLRLDQTEKGN